MIVYPRFANKEEVVMPRETPPQIVDVSSLVGEVELLSGM